MREIRKFVQKLSREQMSVVGGGGDGNGAYEPAQNINGSHPRYAGRLNNSVMVIHNSAMDIQNYGNWYFNYEYPYFNYE